MNWLSNNSKLPFLFILIFIMVGLGFDIGIGMIKDFHDFGQWLMGFFVVFLTTLSIFIILRSITKKDKK